MEICQKLEMENLTVIMVRALLKLTQLDKIDRLQEITQERHPQLMETIAKRTQLLEVTLRSKVNKKCRLAIMILLDDSKINNILECQINIYLVLILQYHIQHTHHIHLEVVNHKFPILEILIWEQ